MYVAIKGTQVDGHRFIDQAISLGAQSIICETLPETLTSGVVFIQVSDAREALARTASNFYDNPSNQLQLIGITGTNGKTSIATLLFDLFNLLQSSAGLISTVAIQYGDHQFTTHTTPDPLTVQQAPQCHGYPRYGILFYGGFFTWYSPKRIIGLEFKGAIFANLTHDHLDYHDTFKAYRDTKKKIFLMACPILLLHWSMPTIKMPK